MESSLYSSWHSKRPARTKEMAKGVLVRARRLISPDWAKHWAEVAGPRHGSPTAVSALQMAQWAV